MKKNLLIMIVILTSFIKNNVSRICLISVLILCINFLNAQPRRLPNDPESAPVDGGLSLLIITGAGYAVRRIRSSKKRE
jgi:hypothetical protein